MAENCLIPRFLLLALLSASWMGISQAFCPPSVTPTSTAASPSSTTSLNLDASLLGPETTEARSNFVIWFFGASGAAGIARQSFPRMIDNIKEIQSYRSDEMAAGGPTVGISPLCGYPRDLCVADLEKIVVKNPLNIEKMVEKYPVENNLWAKKGYITYDAFRRANAKVDPLVVRAVFDCFSQSTEVSNPEIAQAKLDSYAESLETFKADLLYSKATGWAAIIVLLGLLGLADIESYGFAYTGWFPDWPGGRLWLQGGLINPEYGFWTIPKYWI